MGNKCGKKRGAKEAKTGLTEEQPPPAQPRLGLAHRRRPAQQTSQRRHPWGPEDQRQASVSIRPTRKARRPRPVRLEPIRKRPKRGGDPTREASVASGASLRRPSRQVLRKRSLQTQAGETELTDGRTEPQTSQGTVDETLTQGEPDLPDLPKPRRRRGPVDMAPAFLKAESRRLWESREAGEAGSVRVTVEEGPDVAAFERLLGLDPARRRKPLALLRLASFYRPYPNSTDDQTRLTTKDSPPKITASGRSQARSPRQRSQLPRRVRKRR